MLQYRSDKYFFLKPINAYTFGMMMLGRTWSSGSSHRYGFNGQELENEVYNSGQTYSAEFWQYDARLGRRRNVDPLTKQFPGVSPYSCFNNNPILYVDYSGLTPTKNKARLQNKFDKKVERYSRRHPEEINSEKFDPNKYTNEIWKELNYLKSKNIFGKRRSDSRFYEKYRNSRSDPSGTGLTFYHHVGEGTVITGNQQSTGFLIQTHELEATSGELDISYDMERIPDRLEIKNTATGETIFDTSWSKRSGPNGLVRQKRGSGVTVTYDLGASNTNITVVINGGSQSNSKTKASTIFNYTIRVFGDNIQLEQDIDLGK